jgi:predicted dehydrogenase
LEGKIGTVELIELEWLRTKPRPAKTWLADPSLSGGGGVLADLGSHLLMIGLGLIGERHSFEAFAAARCHLEPAGKLEDLVAATIVINDRVLVSLRIGWGMALPDPSQVTTRAYGSRGVLTNDDYVGSKSDGYGRLLDRFVDAIENGTRPDLTEVDDAMQAMHALYRSIHARTSVRGRFRAQTTD